MEIIDNLAEQGADLRTFVRELAQFFRDLLIASVVKRPSDVLVLSDIALDAVERVTPLAERNHVTLETGDLPEAPLMGDRQALLQMVSNLVENGIKYAGGDERRVKVETGQAAESVWVRVADNGPGIAADHLPHIFDRFYRVDQARSRNAEVDEPSGSGLGLAIVQMIVRAHQGEIKVESAPGAGTKFEMNIPLSGRGLPCVSHALPPF